MINVCDMKPGDMQTYWMSVRLVLSVEKNCLSVQGRTGLCHRVTYLTVDEDVVASYACEYCVDATVAPYDYIHWRPS
jgi:hypothetical protein